MARSASRPLVAALEGLQVLARDPDGRPGARLSRPYRCASGALVPTRTRYGPSVPVRRHTRSSPVHREPVHVNWGRLACPALVGKQPADALSVPMRLLPRCAARRYGVGREPAALEGPQVTPVPARDSDGRPGARPVAARAARSSRLGHDTARRSRSVSRPPGCRAASTRMPGPVRLGGGPAVANQ